MKHRIYAEFEQPKKGTKTLAKENALSLYFVAMR